MASSNRDIKPEYVSIMLIGDSGTHKTWFAGHSPRPFFFDFDYGMATLRRVDQEIMYESFRDAARGQDPKLVRFGLHEYGNGWFAFIKTLNEIGALIDKGECPYETLVFDSFTYLAELAVNNILRLRPSTQGGNKLEGLDQQGWGSFLTYMTTITQQIMAWPIRKIFTAHIKRDVNEITSTTEKLPLIGGQFAGKASTLFDEVYYCEVEGTGANRKYKLITEADGMMKTAKTRWGVPSGIPTEWDAVAPYIIGTRTIGTAGKPASIKLSI